MNEKLESNRVDVRVVSLYSQDTDIVPLQVTAPSQHKMLEYFNVIDIRPAEGERPLLNAYHTSRERSTEHKSSQVLLTFTDIRNTSGQYSYTREEIDRFWNDTAEPLLFVTLLNAEDKEHLSRVVDRIREKYAGAKHLVYFTLDYCEAVIFLKCSSFRRCAELVFSLDYEETAEKIDSQARTANKDGISTLLANSLTLYSLVHGFDLNAPDFQPEEHFGVYLRVGMSDARRVREFCRELEDQTRTMYGMELSENWILGRYDVGIYHPQADLRWIGLASRLLDQSQENNPDRPPLSSHTFSILIDPSSGDLQGRIASHNTNNTALSMRMKQEYTQFKDAYSLACRKLDVLPDEVFIHWAGRASMQAVSFCGSNVMSDLGICLVAQFLDFFAYEQRLWSSAHITNRQREKAEACFSTFFSNILILVDGMNHSSRQFILTPPFRTIAFEMPPKVMAYYTALTHRLINIFNDNASEERYGFIIAPQFARELGVRSLAPANSSDVNEFIAIGIGEQWLYQLQHTTAVLAHEISHFVGKRGRERPFRKRCVLLAEMQNILQEMAVELHIALVEHYSDVAVRLGVKLPEQFPEKGAVYIAPSLLEQEAEKLLDILCKCDESYSNEGKFIYKRDLLILMRKVPFHLHDNQLLQNELFDFLWGVLIADQDGITNIGRSIAWTERFYSGTVPIQVVSPDGRSGLPDTSKLQAILNGQSKHRVRSMFLELLKVYANGLAFLSSAQASWVRQTSDLFSEAYADLQAVLLLDLSWDEYCGLFGHLEEPLPDIVQPRLLAMRMVQFADAPPRKHNEEQKDFSAQVRKVERQKDFSERMQKVEELAHTLSKLSPEAEGHKWYQELKAAEIDPSVFRHLKAYLDRCRVSLNNHFETRINEGDNLRRIYRDVSDRNGIYARFDRMMKFIAAYRKELQRNCANPE